MKEHSEIIKEADYECSLYEAIADKRRYRFAFILVLIILAFSIGLNYKQFDYLPDPKVVAQTPDGRIMPIPTLDLPVFATATVLNWAAEKGEALYDLPFTDIARYPGMLAGFMPKEAKDQFLEGLVASGILSLVKDGRLILRGVRSAPPSLVNEYVNDDGRYIWVVDMPVSRIFEGEKERRQDQVVLRMFVGRASLMEYEKNGLVLGSVSVFGKNEVVPQ